MENKLYLLFRKGALPEYNSECIKEIEEITGLDYRTIRGLIKIINNESNITKENLEVLTDKGFYTYENCIYLSISGLHDIIPSRYFSDSSFLQETGIDTLPDMFLANSDEVILFSIAPEIINIGYGAFMNCKNLETIKINSKLQTVGDYAFKGCKNLKELILPNSVSVIGSGVFKGSGIKSFIIPENVKSLKNNTFKDCKELTEVDSIMGNLIDIGRECFCGCKNLKDIDFTVGKCDDKAFYKCTSLDRISISSSSIGKEAFGFCNKLLGIYFENKSPIKIKKDAFKGCENLGEVLSDGFAYELREADGYIYLTEALKKKMVSSNNPQNIFQYCNNIKRSLRIVLG